MTKKTKPTISQRVIDITLANPRPNPYWMDVSPADEAFCERHRPARDKVVSAISSYIAEHHGDEFGIPEAIDLIESLKGFIAYCDEPK